MKKTIGIMLGLGLAVAANAAIIEGDVIYVDFGANAAVGNYNQIYSAQMSVADTVRLSDGATTGVGLGVTAIGSVASPVADLSSHSAGNALNTTDANLYADGIAANDTTVNNDDSITITFTGLDTSLTYGLVGGFSTIASKDQNFETVWTVEQGDTDPSELSDATIASGYVSFSGLATTDGTLTITLTDNAYKHAAVSQLSLTAIPEPATLGLVAAFGGAVLFIRRRFML
ncbi:PEP-CTERM sorting domain-containing protein [Pontiellaceae bacterium B12227]|nr:PEP-CTERM sorting domain-containing protein [Pontiellaceae bacterium B12227]